VKKNRVGIPIDEERMAWFTPRENITAYQLARIAEVMWMASLSGEDAATAFSLLPPGCLTHFDYTGSDIAEEAL